MSSAERARGPLSRDEVVAGALAIIDEKGLDGLTMRALAARLDVSPASLYWHAGGRAQLLALVSQLVLESLDLPDRAMPWTTWVRELAQEIRRVLSRHPNLAAYLTSNLSVSLVSLQLSEATVDVLHRAGFRGEALLSSYNVIMGTVFGWIAAEYAVDPAGADREWRERFEDQLVRAEESELPVLRREMSVLANRAFMLRWSSAKVMPMGGSFAFLLDVLIAGLEQALRRETAT